MRSSFDTPHGEALLKRLDLLETTGRNLVARIGILETGGVTPGFSTGSGGSSLIGLTQRVAQLERSLHTGSGGPVDHMGVLPELFGRSPGEVERPFEAGLGGVGATRAHGEDSATLEPRFLSLEAKVRDLEAQMDNVTVSMGGHTFKSVNDCETFILQHIPGNSYAHFYDVVSLLQRGWGHNHVGIREVWDLRAQEGRVLLTRGGRHPRLDGHCAPFLSRRTQG